MVTLQYFYCSHCYPNYKRKKANYSKINILTHGVLKMVWPGNELHKFKSYDQCQLLESCQGVSATTCMLFVNNVLRQCNNFTSCYGSSVYLQMLRIGGSIEVFLPPPFSHSAIFSPIPHSGNICFQCPVKTRHHFC